MLFRKHRKQRFESFRVFVWMLRTGFLKFLFFATIFRLGIWGCIAQNPTIVFEQPINSTQGGGIPDLGAGDWFGYDMAPIGDLNGDGVNDIAVGAIYDDDGGVDRGAVYILFMTSTGTVGSYQKISSTQGGFQGVLVDESYFGSSMANLGDMNGDGVQDLAVGATGDDDGGTYAGAVWILFMNSDGTVNGFQKISALSGSFNAGLEDWDRFGIGLDSIGDLNNDGVTDIAVGAFWDDDGGLDRGAVYIIYLNSNGTVQSFQKISQATPGFTGDLSDGASFGWAVSYMGDVNGDGNIEILVGAQRDNVSGFEEGSVWVISITNAGSIVQTTEISVGTSPVLANAVTGGSRFGSSVTLVHDLWCDNAPDIAVGLQGYGANAEGAVFLIDLDANFYAQGVLVIAEGQAGLQAPLDPLDRFGWGLDVTYDYNGDGFSELMVGSVNFDGGGSNIGGSWLISLEPSSSQSILSDTARFCSGSQILLYPTDPIQNTLWSTGETTDTISVSSSSQVWVSGTLNDCLISDTILVVVDQIPLLELGTDTTVCDQLALTVAASENDILWSNGVDQQAIVANQSGSYWVQLSGACGNFSDTIDVTVVQTLQMYLGADTVMCDDIQLSLTPTITNGVPDLYTWNDGTSNSSLSVSAEGKYWVSMSNFCGTVSDTIEIVSGNAPNVYLPLDTSVCGELTLEAGYPGYDVLWSTGETSERIQISQSGTYSLSLTGECGTITRNFAVTVYSEPSADFLTRSKPVEFLNPNVQFVNESNGASQYEWYFGDRTMSYEENPLHGYDTSGVYLVMLIAYGTSDIGCVDTTYGYIEVDPMFTFYVPNAFTPDGDGINDTWGGMGLNFEYESFELEIFDRWGGMMWRTDNPNKGWDGTHMDSGKRVKQGMYVYQFRIRQFNTFKPKVLKGTVTVYRHN